MNDQALFVLIEDNENDALLIRRAFVHAKILNPLLVLKSAEEGMAYFLGTGKYANRVEFPLPTLVLLDLNLPGISGIDFLRWVRAQTGISTTRVVVLTASDSLKDVNAAYQAGANSFLIKPVDFERFVEISRALNGYWIWLDHPPETERSAPPQSQKLPVPPPQLPQKRSITPDARL